MSSTQYTHATMRGVLRELGVYFNEDISKMIVLKMVPQPLLKHEEFIEYCDKARGSVIDLTATYTKTTSSTKRKHAGRFANLQRGILKTTKRRKKKQEEKEEKKKKEKNPFYSLYEEKMKTSICEAAWLSECGRCKMNCSYVWLCDYCGHCVCTQCFIEIQWPLPYATSHQKCTETNATAFCLIDHCKQCYFGVYTN